MVAQKFVSFNPNDNFVSAEICQIPFPAGFGREILDFIELSQTSL